MAKFTHLTDIAKVVDYNWKDEERHFEECEPNGRKGHIFQVLKRLRSWIIRESGNMADHNVIIRLHDGVIDSVDGLPSWWTYEIAED